MRKGRASPPAFGVSTFSHPVRRVAVVGSTHGNKRTGVWYIKVIERQRGKYDESHERGAGENTTSGNDENNDDRVNVFLKFPSLEIETPEVATVYINDLTQ